MSISMDGQSSVPPGFRFHPTEEELLNYYLRKKVACQKIDLDVIRDVDLNKLEPWDIQEKCRIGSTPQNDWYFFSHKDKKYPTGTRTNRATAAGFWKATGRDKVIYTSTKRIGMRKTLVFYRGRAPHGQKSDWIMHEYRMEEHSDHSNSMSNVISCSVGEGATQEDGWVVCRVFKKKNFHKAMGSPCNNNSASTAKTQLSFNSSSDGALDQILQYMGRSCKQETVAVTNTINAYQTGRHLRPAEAIFGTGSLPSLTDDSPIGDTSSCFNRSSYQPEGIESVLLNANRAYEPESDWTALDWLVASHLNGQSEDPTFMFSSGHGNDNSEGGGSGDGDLWSLASSASEYISHVSHGCM